MRNRGLPPGLAVFFAALPLFGWWMTGLFDIDEGFYGAVVAEMNRRHEWITPFFNGHPWFEKPILLYWLAKPCMMLFGPDFGPRLPSVICTILLFVVCGYFAKKRYDVSTQLMTIFCLGTSLLVIGLGRQMMTDAPLNLALTTAFLSFYESLVGDKRWRLLTAFCLGLGVLAKGPVAIILFALIVGITLGRDKDLRIQWKGYWLAGAGILLATVATWYIPCYLANGQTFVDEFLIKQNVGRFLGGDQAHSLGLKGLPYYVPVVILAIFPWGWIELPAFGKKNIDDSFSRFLAAWALVVFVFFTISGARLVHYVLPMVPPMALLVGKKLAAKPWFAWTKWQPQIAMGYGIFLMLVLVPLQGYIYSYLGQAEAHYLVRKHPEIEVLYQLGRQEKDLGTGSTKLQETSLPSLIMYLNHSVIETDDENKLFYSDDFYVETHDESTKHYVPADRVFFTRKSRIRGLQHKVKIIEETEHFGVYKFDH